MENDELFFLADKAISDGKIVEAEEMLNTIITNNPNYGKAHNYLGWLFQYNYIYGKGFKAERHYKLAVQFNPIYSATYINYALLLYNENRLEEHLTLLEKAEAVKTIKKARLYKELGINY